MSTVKKNLIRVLILAMVALAAYFINVEVQTRLGRTALRETGLEIHSLEQAFAIAQTESKPVLANLSAIWCPNCRKLDRKVFSDPAVGKTIERNFVYARIEYESEEGERFRQKYGLDGFPNLLILNADGTPVRRLQIGFDPEKFNQQLLQ